MSRLDARRRGSLFDYGKGGESGAAPGPCTPGSIPHFHYENPRNLVGAGERRPPPAPFFVPQADPHL